MISFFDVVNARHLPGVDASSGSSNPRNNRQSFSQSVYNDHNQMQQGMRQLQRERAASSASASSRASSYCRFFFQGGTCRNGDACRFSHDAGVLSRTQVLKTIACPFFLSGSCRYGDYCDLRHDQITIVGEDGDSTTKVGENSSEDVICGICLEKPRNYGILSCCDHAFCYSCLMEWRKEGSIDVTSRRVCPTCRKTSDYVVSSSIMPTNGQEKERVLREYKSNCATKSCKHFDVGRLGSCPFGSDCFFAHTSINGKDIKSRDKSMQQLYEIRQRDRNERNSNDISYITDMLMMMGLQRHLVRRERERGESRGENGRWERDDDDNSENDDVNDEDDDILSLSDLMTGLLLDNPDLLDIFSSFGDN